MSLIDINSVVIRMILKYCESIVLRDITFNFSNFNVRVFNLIGFIKGDRRSAYTLTGKVSRES